MSELNPAQILIAARDKKKWEDRWKVIEALIESMMSTLPKDLPRRTLFVCLLSHLQDFSRGQFYYFYTKLRAGEAAPDGFSHDQALSWLIDQTGFDLTLIAQAIQQRHTSTSADIRTALQVADQFAERMLAPSRTFFTEMPAVLTYLQKSAHSRVIPYAPVAMVAVPYTCVPAPGGNSGLMYRRDYLALPHEIGHYVYWHGTIPEGAFAGLACHRAIPSRMTKLGMPNWALDWAEEIFADVYGCRVAGPMIALDFQDLQVDLHARASFVTNDGEHPTPYLRPEIYLHTLEALQMGKWARALGIRWSHLRDALAPSQPTLLTHGTDGSSGPGDTTLDNARNLLKAITVDLNQALDPVKFGADNLKPIFTVTVDRPMDTSQVERMFELWAGIDPTSIGDLGAQFEDHCLPFVWLDWKNQQLEQSLLSVPLATNESKESREWLVVMRAGGWTTEGPDSNPDPK